MTYRDLIHQGQKRLFDAGQGDQAAQLLMAELCRQKNINLYLEMEEEADADLASLYLKDIALMEEGKPLSYVLGYESFYGYDFIVNEDVLIPRYETEELVENILYRYDEHFKGQKVNVCDLATGSGCIAISLAKEEPNMNVVATDISKDAIKVAKMNNEKMGANVKFLIGDMLEPLKGKKFDIFVSNPPYIPDSEEVMPLVKDNEPNIALFGGDDGMKFYRIILSGLKPYLNKKAMIAFEHGYDKKKEMIELANKYFPNAKVEVLKDLEGRDRMTFIYVGDFKWEE